MKNKISPKYHLVVGLLTLVALVLAACQPQVIPVTGDMPEEEMSVTIEVASDPNLGDYLVGENDMTLYMFAMDGPNTVNCNADCLGAWPPLLVEDNVRISPRLDPNLLGEAALSDGTMVVTYNQMPLYYWVNDIEPGDITGQGFNNVWYVVSPEGEPIGMMAEEEMAPVEEQMVPVLLKIYNHPEFGEILSDGEGMILYMFTQDGPNQVNCTGACLEAWPPFLAVDDYELGEGIDENLIGTASLPDGREIVTYNEMPLYYWVGDSMKGDTNGQGVNDVWYVVSADGEVVTGMMVDEEMEYEY